MPGGARTASTKACPPGLTSAEKTEPAAADKRIAELAIHRRAGELLGKAVPPKDSSRRSR